MFLMVVTDKTAHFDTLKSLCHVFAHERSLFRSGASVKWSAGVYLTVNNTVVSEHAHLRSHSFRDVADVH